MNCTYTNLNECAMLCCAVCECESYLTWSSCSCMLMRDLDRWAFSCSWSARTVSSSRAEASSLSEDCSTTLRSDTSLRRTAREMGTNHTTAGVPKHTVFKVWPSHYCIIEICPVPDKRSLSIYLVTFFIALQKWSVIYSRLTVGEYHGHPKS